MPRSHSVLREGFVAGLIGATSVAIWFLIVDLLVRSPLYTPRVLGRALWSVFGPIREGTIVFVATYTVFHYAAFIIIGIIIAVIIHWADREPGVLAGFLILFVAFELGFYGLSSILDHFVPLGDLAWYQVAIGNLIASALMGTYFYRLHPSITRELQYVLNGEDDR
jgi:hypothetical protein